MTPLKLTKRPNRTAEAKALAWFVEVDSMTCVVFAATAAKAKWIAVKGYRDAGYGNRGTWPPTSVGRRERYDKSPLRHQKPRPWTEDYVQDTLNLMNV